MWIQLLCKTFVKSKGLWFCGTTEPSFMQVKERMDRKTNQQVKAQEKERWKEILRKWEEVEREKLADIAMQCSVSNFSHSSAFNIKSFLAEKY